ncbi:MAG: DUF4893 domain-containing protein [Alphaproteobacteria bacterium]|nr:DUF4893 domain-containing protein [Alphaproteobacteria bacterium]MDX5369095.1 DUF4893 domain-containing protein [Alphaproteobacteria bacterium]MDX5463788.1 DUF4893 domain-containing protein [Alphaproteobacteria bacterium]
MRAFASLSLIAALLLATVSAAAQQAPFQQWQAVIAERDEARFIAIPQVRDRARELAESYGQMDELETLRALLDSPAQPLDVAALPGTYPCRTITLAATPGHREDLKIHGWFTCRIAETADGITFEKLTGSWRTAGWLYAETEFSRVYLGAKSDPGAARLTAYGESASRNEVAVLEQVGPGHYRMMFGADPEGSRFTVLDIDVQGR